MVKTHKFITPNGDNFLIWFLPQKIEVRRGESHVAWRDHDYTKTQLEGLKLWQCADLLFVGAPDDTLPHPLMVLAHFADTDWRWDQAQAIVPSAPIYNAPDWVRT